MELKCAASTRIALERFTCERTDLRFPLGSYIKWCACSLPCVSACAFVGRRAAELMMSVLVERVEHAYGCFHALFKCVDGCVAWACNC